VLRPRRTLAQMDAAPNGPRKLRLRPPNLPAREPDRRSRQLDAMLGPWPRTVPTTPPLTTAPPAVTACPWDVPGGVSCVGFVNHERGRDGAPFAATPAVTKHSGLTA
jgi:hypothetical protein